MTYKGLKEIIKKNHQEEFDSLLPDSAKFRADEVFTADRQISMEFGEEFAMNKIAEKYGYEIDENLET